MHVKMICRYNGSKFHGFATQGTLRTVQTELEQSISQYFGVPTKVVGAGRTDAGVHAEGQTVSFLFPADAKFNAEKLCKGINALLPKDISVLSCELLEKFNARSDAKSKTYIYKYKTTKSMDPAKLQIEANKLIGTHDFSSFSAEKNCKNPICSITDFKVTKHSDNQVWFTITGNRFLKNMVRIIVGKLTGNTGKAPADGLTLYRVEY